MTNPHQADPAEAVALLPCPFCGGGGLTHRVPTGWRVSCKNCDCQPRPGFPADTEAEAITAWNTRTIPPTAASGEHEWPDIGAEPLTLPRPRDIEEAKARLNGPAITQQPHVPNGTALVWRTDLLDVKYRLIRMEALADSRKAHITTLETRLAHMTEAAGKMADHIAEQITFAEWRIQDGKDMGASVWRLALEDIVRENRQALERNSK